MNSQSACYFSAWESIDILTLTTIQTLDLFGGLNLGMSSWEGSVEHTVMLRKMGWIIIVILSAGSEINRGIEGEKNTLVSLWKINETLKMKGRNTSLDSNGYPLLYFSPLTKHSLSCQIFTCECANWVICGDL